MRRVVPSALVLGLLVCLLPIYQARPTNEVLILSVLLLAVGVLLGFGNQPRGLQILVGIDVLMSLIGMSFLGRALLGANGGPCFVILWILALAGAGFTLWRRTTLVERGQIMVVNQLPENRILLFTEGVHRPLAPSFERVLAVLPAYELAQQIELERLNTESLFNVEKIDLHIRYRVASPRDVVVKFPNRERALEQLQREQGTPETNTDQAAFWTTLLQRQIDGEVEAAARWIIAAITAPSQVARGRNAIADAIKTRLQESVARWGIDILELRLLEVVVDPEGIKAVNRDRTIARELQDAQRKAEVEAQSVIKVGEAQAKATARMVAEIVGALKQQGAELSPDDLERIISTAMQRTAETQQLSGLLRQVSSSSSGGTPGSGIPPTG